MFRFIILKLKIVLLQNEWWIAIWKENAPVAFQRLDTH